MIQVMLSDLMTLLHPLEAKRDHNPQSISTTKLSCFGSEGQRKQSEY